MITEVLPKRFLDKLNITDSCWLWTACRTRNGYGRYALTDGAWGSAHRVSWFYFNGEIPDGLSVLHKCDVRSCVNPDHLFLGTYKDNAIDRNQKGRNYSVAGEGNGRAKLTVDDVREIRKIYQPGRGKENNSSGLAKRFGVTVVQIMAVLNKKAWNGVE